MRLLFLILILFSFSCKEAGKEMYGDINAEIEDTAEAPATTKSSIPQEAPESEQITRKTIKTGNIAFQSDDIEKDYKAVKNLISKSNAYIENENQSKTTYRINYNLIIRVTSGSYDSLFNSLSGLTTKLDNKSSSVKDATGRYYDLRTRIRNKKALEQRYIELLKKATDIKNILEVEKSLNKVRTEIEQLEGQFNYLSKQINFSTIHLSFYEELPYTYASSQRKGFGAKLLNSLDNGWQVFLSFLLGITSMWPFLILIAGGIYLFKKVRIRWKKKK